MENTEEQEVDINDLFTVIEKGAILEVGKCYADVHATNSKYLSPLSTIFKFQGITDDNRLKFEYVAGDNEYEEHDGFTHFFNPNNWTLVEPKQKQ